MKSLTELSHDLGISKPSIYQRMNKISNFRSKYTFKNNNILMIKNKGISLISNPKSNSTSKNFHVRKGSSSQITSAKKSEIISQLLKLNKKQALEIQNIKRDSRKMIRNSYRHHGLPSPKEWQEYKKFNHTKDNYIKELKKCNINRMSKWQIFKYLFNL